MTSEVIFKDAVFTREVVLRGTSRALYIKAEREFERLKLIRNLGVISHINEDSSHSRHQHLVGMLAVFERLLIQPKKRGLPKKFLWSFWPKICFAQAGHAAFGYDAERAVLLACRLSPAIRKRLLELVSPVFEHAKSCETCDKKANCEVAVDCNFEDEFNKCIDEYEWDKLHYWIAAAKLISDRPLLAILESKSSVSDADPGFAEAEMMKILLVTRCKWSKSVGRLKQLDFVLRDLILTGTINVQMDFESMISSANEDHSDWQLLNHLYEYVSETIYAESHARTIRSLFTRSLASFLIDNKVNLEELFGFGESPIADGELRARLRRYNKSRALFDPGFVSTWKTWSIDLAMPREQSPYDQVAAVAGDANAYLSGPYKHNLMIFKSHGAKEISIGVRYENRENRPSCKKVVTSLFGLVREFGDNCNEDLVYKTLFEICAGKAVRGSSKTTVEGLAQHSKFEDVETMMEVLARMGKSETSTSGDEGDQKISINMKVGDQLVPVTTDGSFFVNYMRGSLAALADETKDKLEVFALFWGLVYRSQHNFVNSGAGDALAKLLSKMCDRLARSVIDRTPTSELDFELLAFLKAFELPGTKVASRIIVPGLKVLGSDLNEEFEFDVAAIVTCRSKVAEFHLWECTLEKRLGRKRTADTSKMIKFGELLSQRWGEDIKVIRNSCYVSAGEIRIEFNGVTTSVSLP